MCPSLHVLIVEDLQVDIRLMLQVLHQKGEAIATTQVETAQAMQMALEQQPWDFVISGYQLAAFSALEALQLVEGRNIPLIIVCDILSEDLAVEALQAGAYDVITHKTLGRLAPIIQMALRDSEAKRQREIADQARRESEQRYQTLVNAVPVGIFITDTTGHCIYVNDRWCELTGISASAAQQVGWSQTLHPDDRDRVFTEWYRCAQANLPFKAEYRFLNASGATVWVLGQAIAERNVQGDVIGYLGSITDISDQKQSLQERQAAVAEAKQKEQMLRALFDSAFQFMGVLTPEGILVFANQTALDAMDIKLADVVGQPFWATPWWAHFPDQQAILQQAITRAAQGEFIRFEAQHLLANGSVSVVDFSLKPVFDDLGQVIMLIPEGRDMSDRQQAEQKIREQAALLDITTDAISVRDLDHRILYWNKGAERLYGWTASEVMGRKVPELLGRNGSIMTQLNQIQLAMAQTGYWRGELQKSTKSGQVLTVESQWTLMCDPHGNPKSILIVSTDITEKKQLETQLLRNQRLESLGTLASGIAHDFNNLLTPVMAAAQLLPIKLTDLDEQSQQLLRMIESSTQRGADLVKQILAFARGAEGKRMPLQARHLVSEILQVVRQTFPKNIEIETKIPTTDLWPVLADATQLYQVLMNLCVNARDAMPNGGVLKLAIASHWIDEPAAQRNLDARAGSYILMTVADTGVGIAGDCLDRIFDPFFTTKEQGKGTGLGLSTALGIVKNHGGFIHVESAIGQGTQFQIYIPAIDETVTPQATESHFTSGHQELILIVDDEPLIQQVAQAALMAYNYRTLTAKDGMEAIALFTEHVTEIKIVLMDAIMPAMDGLTAIRTLHKIDPNVRVISTSGLISNSQLAAGASLGVKAFLAKPYTAKELLDVVQKVIAMNPSESFIY